MHSSKTLTRRPNKSAVLRNWVLLHWVLGIGYWVLFLFILKEFKQSVANLYPLHMNMQRRLNLWPAELYAVMFEVK